MDFADGWDYLGLQGNLYIMELCCFYRHQSFTFFYSHSPAECLQKVINFGGFDLYTQPTHTYL